MGDDNQKTTQSSAGDSRDDHPASDGMTTVGLRNLSDQLEVALIEGDAPRRTREGYVAALVLIADFLEDVKFPVTIRDELLQLAAGLQELDRGTVRDFLKVLAAQNHPTDPSDVWQTRALIAIAVDQMMSGGLSKREAGRRITKWFSELKSVSGTKSDNFGSAVCDWHTRLTNGTVKDGAAIGTWNGKERLIARQRENIARAGTSSPEPLQIAYIILRGMLPLDNLKRSRSEREADHSFRMLREPSTEREFTRLQIAAERKAPTLSRSNQWQRAPHGGKSMRRLGNEVRNELAQRIEPARSNDRARRGYGLRTLHAVHPSP